MRAISLQSRRRAGFTLVELVIVIGIITILAALLAAAIFRVGSGQSISRTEATLIKLGSALDQQWQAVIDDVNDDTKNGRIPSAILTDPNVLNDRDLAKAIWLKLKLRHEFPQSIAEATSDVSFNNSQSGSVVVLPKKQVYVNALSSASGLNPNEESSACLYVAFGQSRRGQSFDPDAVGQGIVQTKGNVRLFIDGWGNPIPFQRFSQLAEMDQTEYARPGPAPRNSLDPQDPLGRLQIYNALGLNAPLGISTAAAFHWGGSPAPNHNFSPYVWSYGADKAANTADDIYSFRLMKAGRRGN